MSSKSEAKETTLPTLIKINRGELKIPEEIKFFSARTDFYEFSNFFYAPITYNGVLYPTSEHAFQRQKLKDKSKFAKILDNVGIDKKNKYFKPGEVYQEINKKHSIFNPNKDFKYTQSEWDEKKYSIMKDIVKEKLKQHYWIRVLLFKTKNSKIYEVNPHDRYWSITSGGFNALGKILMELRSKIKKKENKY